MAEGLGLDRFGDTRRCEFGDDCFAGLIEGDVFRGCLRVSHAFVIGDGEGHLFEEGLFGCKFLFGGGNLLGRDRERLSFGGHLAEGFRFRLRFVRRGGRFLGGRRSDGWRLPGRFGRRRALPAPVCEDDDRRRDQRGQGNPLHEAFHFAASFSRRCSVTAISPA